jgi:hypothetical protein
MQSGGPHDWHVCKQVLSNASPMERNGLGINEWDYYEIRLDAPVAHLLLELYRTSGNPVLVFRQQGSGYEPYGLPTPQDLDSYADVDSANQQLNYHHLLLTNLQVCPSLLFGESLSACSGYYLLPFCM